MKVPEILEAFPKVSGEDARKIASILAAVDRPEDVSSALEEASRIIGGFGVEALQPEGAWVDRYWYNNILDYVNMGDPYVTTIMYDTQKGEFLIGLWGDFLETWEQENVEKEEEVE